jgi:hypothetical protein
MHPGEKLFIIAYLLVWGLGFLGEVFIVTTLKRWHHDTWLKIGTPSIGMFPGLRSRRYRVWRRSGHEQLGDRRLSLVVRINNVALLLGLGMTIWMAVYAIVQSLAGYY